MAKPDDDAILLLDMGTHVARAAVAQSHDGALGLTDASEAPFSAAHDGIIVHLEAAREQLAAVLESAAQRAGTRTRRVVAAVGGSHLRWIRARGSLSLRLPVCLREAHLERALDAAAAIGLPRDQEMLHVVPTGFRVDGARTLRPLGMRARRLVAEVGVLTVSRLALENLERVLCDAGFELVEPVADPLVAAQVGLTAEDRSRGAVLVDIGAERVGAVVYRDGVLQGLTQLGAGAAHVSRDLACVLRVDTSAAEHVKRELGVAYLALADAGRSMPLQRNGELLRLGQVEVARVIEARVRELLTLTREALRGALAPTDRVVVGGGGARLSGMVTLAEQVFGVPARRYVPDGAVPGLADASAGTLLGLQAYALRCGFHRSRRHTFLRGAVQRLRSVLGVGGSRPSASGHARPEIRVAEPETGRSVHVPPSVGVDLEVGDVRVRA